MKKISTILIVLSVITVKLTSCNSHSQEGASSTQQTKSKEVTIGNQVWMTENLNVDKFSNGDPIPEAKTNEEWMKAGEERKPAWCYYENNPTNGEKYGKLYNWYAVNDPRGLAPTGWHIPSYSDWNNFMVYLKNQEDTDLKRKSFKSWIDSGNKGGIRRPDGIFEGFETSTWWSSSDSIASIDRWYTLMGDRIEELYFPEAKELPMGFSVRCLKN